MLGKFPARTNDPVKVEGKLRLKQQSDGFRLVVVQDLSQGSLQLR